MEATRRASAMDLLRAGSLSFVLGFSAPGVARGESYPMDAAGAGVVFQGLIQERDIGLLLDYLREATRDMAQGREPPAPPPEMEARAADLAAELKARGTLAALMVLNLLEEQAKKALRRELAPRPPSALPPTIPYTAVGVR